MNARRPAPGSLALTCPTCGVRPVCTAQRYSIVRGYIVFAKFGSVTAIGCRECVRAAGSRALGLNAMLGWWSIPWGLITPFLIIQNLIRMIAAPPGCLDDALRAAGLDTTRFRVDAQGLTPLEWDLLRVAGSTRRRFADAAGIRLSETTGSAFLIELSEHRITERQAQGLLVATDFVSPLAVPLELRDQLLWMLGDLIPLDDAAAYIAPLQATARWLQCSPETLSAMLTALGEQLGAPSTTEPLDIELAYATIGVRADATRDEIQRTYKRLVMQWHPDRAVANGVSIEEATVRTQSITVAYRTIMQARGWSGASTN